MFSRAVRPPRLVPASTASARRVLGEGAPPQQFGEVVADGSSGMASDVIHRPSVAVADLSASRAVLST